MKVQYITDACVVIEHNNIKVLCDPWLSESACYGALYHYPPLKFKPEDFLDVNYIYISHIHEDHLDADTLNCFPKDIPILIHNYEEKHVLNRLKRLGFSHIEEVPHKGSVSLGKDFTIEILAADNCDPQICFKFFGCRVSQLYERSLQIDSLAVFSGGGKTVVNTNDCPYELSYPINQYILSKYTNVDLLLTSYNAASPYPQCFQNFNEEEMLAEKEKIRKKCLNRAIQYLEDLKPKYFIPFAAQYIIGGKLTYLNKYRAVTELEELEGVFKDLLEENKIHSKLVLLNSGEWIDLDKNSVSALFSLPSKEEKDFYVNNVLPSKKYLFEDSEYFVPLEKREDLTEKLKIAQRHMYSKMDSIYNGIRLDWKLYIDSDQDFLYCVPFDGQDVSKVQRGEEIEPFIRIEINYNLLVMILNRKAHWSNAEFGNFLTYLRKPNVFNQTFHHCLSYLHC